ncbi:unnamed protein product, partial [Durusdinium trenchii]
TRVINLLLSLEQKNKAERQEQPLSLITLFFSFFSGGTTLVLALTAPAITFLQRQGSLQLRALPRQANFQTLKRPVFDGLDDLEEEEEVEDSTLGTVPKEQSMVPRPLGTGIQMLEELYGKHRGCKEPPEMNEEDLEDLHAMLKEELPRCPSISSVAWVAKVLEDLELE